MAKTKDAFRTISEVAEWLEVAPHVLRFWESKFSQVKPVKRAGGRRYYRPADMQLLGGIKTLLHDQGLTVKGVHKMLSDQGVKHVSALSPSIECLDSDSGSAAPKETAAKSKPKASETPPPPVEVTAEPANEDTGEVVHFPASDPAPDALPEKPAQTDDVPEEVAESAAVKAEDVSTKEAVDAPEEAAPETAAPTPKPKIIDTPPDPSDRDPSIAAAGLGALGAHDTAALQSKAARIRPIYDRLCALAKQMDDRR